MAHPHANVVIKVGTTLARVLPENREKYQLLLERASKVPTAKQARTNALRGGVTRSYPKHIDGTSTAHYVAEYYARNRATFIGTTRFLDGTPERYRAVAEAEYRSTVCRVFGELTVMRFYQPLSTAPQFAQVDEVIEEEATA